MSHLTNEQTTSSSPTKINDKTYVYHTCFPQPHLELFAHYIRVLHKKLDIGNHVFDLLTKKNISYKIDIIELGYLVVEANHFQTNLLFAMFLLGLKTNSGENLLDLFLGLFIKKDIRSLETIVEHAKHIISKIKSIVNSLFFCLRAQKRILASRILSMRNYITHQIYKIKLKERKPNGIAKSDTRNITSKISELEETVEDISPLVNDITNLLKNMIKFKELKNINTKYINESELLLFKNVKDKVGIDKEAVLVKVVEGKTYEDLKAMDTTSKKQLISKIYSNHMNDIKNTFDANQINTNIELQEVQKKLYNILNIIKYTFTDQLEEKIQIITNRSHQLGILENIYDNFERLNKTLERYFDNGHVE